MDITSDFRTSWGDWLDPRPWTHFGTFTFAYDASPAHVERQSKRWLRRIEQRAQNKVGWFYVIERGAAGHLHLHALTSGTAHLDSSSIAAAWPAGRADVAVYEPTRGAAHYVTKDLGTRAVHWDFDFVDS
jgi:hypothetical protein